MRIKRNTVLLALLTAGLLGVGLLGGTAKAQSTASPEAFQGRFTLPYQVHWGRAVLPPGDYLLTFDEGTASLIVIEDAKSFKHVALEPASIRQGHCTGESALKIGTRGAERVVDSLQIKELDETFIYPANRMHGRDAEEARRAQSVPVLVAKK